MARAKQTNRAEARRRYRQTMPLADAADEVLEASAISGSAGPEGRPAAKLPAQKPSNSSVPARMGIMDSFRAAYHRANVRDDLRHIREVVTSPALLIVIAIMTGVSIAFMALPNYTGTTALFQLLVFPVGGAALAPFLFVGWFARRASYLAGLITGLVQGSLFLLAITVVGPRMGISFDGDTKNAYLSAALINSPGFGLFFAAAGAWYRRFLRFSSPRATQQGRPAGKPAQKRSTARR